MNAIVLSIAVDCKAGEATVYLIMLLILIVVILLTRSLSKAEITGGSFYL